jgi:radical SAM superfamily enzyme YgiQ (UPF0313 family)
MKVLLLSVNSETFFYSQVVIPFGLASLGSYVQQDGHIIKGIEMNSPPELIPGRYLNVDRRLLDEITRFSPDLVAMSVYAENVHNVMFWAETIKRALPETTVAAGGNHASYIAKEMLEKCLAIDVIVRFEGEIPFRQLCDRLEKNNKNYDDIPNITYRKNGNIIENEVAGLIPDLDTLPRINRDFFEDDSSGTPSLSHADVITARGCPFNCTFCNCNHYWGKKYRTMPILRTVGELESLNESFPDLKSIRFRDESISINRKYCLELCDTLIEKNLGLEFEAHSRLDGLLDEEVVERLSKAGFRKLFIGLESGSQAVLNRLKKGIDVKNIYELVPLLRKHGIDFRLSLMLGTPRESMEESIKTIQLAEELDLAFDEFYFGFGITIYPGTSDCEDFLRKYPGYRWLERRDLKDGYKQSLDSRGNVISVSYVGAEYGREELYKEINKNLQRRLLKYGETDYSLFKQNSSAVERIYHNFRNKNEILDINTGLLRTLDSLGKRWGVYREGVYYSGVFADVCEKGNFKNFARIFSPGEEISGGLSAIKKDIEGVKYLVMAVSHEEIIVYETLGRIFGRWGFNGELLSVDKVFKTIDCPGRLDFNPDSILNMTRVDRKIYWRNYYLLKILKTLRIYSVVKKLYELLRR